MRAKIFELSDVARFAYPSLADLDVMKTAANIQVRTQEKSFLSYGAAMSRLPGIVSGRLSDADIISELSFFGSDWKNRELQSVAKLLRGELAAKGTWYALRQDVIELLPGIHFRPSAKGILFQSGKAFAVAINARKRQNWTSEHRAFIARGVYESTCAEDPNDPMPMILDLSASDGGDRELKKQIFAEHELMPLSAFETTIGLFFEALNLAGIGTPPGKAVSIADLFRRPRWMRS